MSSVISGNQSLGLNASITTADNWLTAHPTAIQRFDPEVKKFEKIPMEEIDPSKMGY